MARFLSLLLLCVLSCGNIASDETGIGLSAKDYSAQHAEALSYCRQNNFNEDYYFLIDLSLHSGRNRFFVYDFNGEQVKEQGLVTHGSCDAFENNAAMYEKAKFSNRIDSHCSSKGKYRIGKRDYSSWGINVKYWLDGLEETNSNARGRVVVLHSWSAVKDSETYPSYSPLSWGCPAVSDNFMRKLDEKLKAASKPVLLWIIE